MSASHAVPNAAGERSRLVRRLVPLAIAAGLLCFTLVAGATAARASAFAATVSIVTPVTITAEGCGNTIQLSGNLHEVFHETADSAGGLLINELFNPQGISGTDASGAKYQGTGETQQDFTFASGGTITETYVNNFKIVGQGTAVNYMVHENTHLTVNPDGTLTTFHDNFSITCQ